MHDRSITSLLLRLLEWLHTLVTSWLHTTIKLDLLIGSTLYIMDLGLIFINYLLEFFRNY